MSHSAPKRIAGKAVIPAEDIVPANHWHRVVQAGAAMTVVAAGFCGMELHKLRKRIGHGGWEMFVSNFCEFSPSTARRYMDLAEGLRGRLKSVTVTDLISRAPSDLNDAERVELLALVGKITDGAALTELYRDFGILKARGETEPTGPGGYKVNLEHLQSFLRSYHPELVGTAYGSLPEPVAAAFRRWVKHLHEEEEGRALQMSLDFYVGAVSRFDEVGAKRTDIIQRMPPPEREHLLTTIETWAEEIRRSLTQG